MSRRVALIIGITGQDGAYLAHFLLSMDYELHGASRHIDQTSVRNLEKIGLVDRVSLHQVDTIDMNATMRLLEQVKPDEIYDLAGQSSVGLSFEQPVEAFHSISLRAINLLECLRGLRSSARLFHASSSECFGETTAPANEATPFRPRSPYAIAKAAAFWSNVTYRESYGIYVSSGILSNHESPLRSDRFVTRKIVRAATRIGRGEPERLSLGFLGIRRDWGWAPEFVEAMWRTLQHEESGDYVIATGQTRSLEELVALAFDAVGQDWRRYVDLDDELFRPTEIINAACDPSRVRDLLGWRARSGTDDVIRYLMRCEEFGGMGPLPWIDKSYVVAD